MGERFVVRSLDGACEYFNTEVVRLWCLSNMRDMQKTVISDQSTRCSNYRQQCILTIFVIVTNDSPLISLFPD
jgi:hypothetical protein